MKLFAVFSGFLGSGKTSTMIALVKYYTDHYGKAAMISNDLGVGVTLADYRLSKLSGINASEITDECICFCHDVLTERLNTCYKDGCELVVSDIPGFGVGALEHVYHGLNERWPGQFELAPFTVLIEPMNVALLRSGESCDMAFILHAQLLEADLIVLNKCDLLNASEQEADRRWLAEQYPKADTIAISTKNADGLESLLQFLIHGRASLQHPSIDYENADLQNAMSKLTEYYLQYYAQVCCNDFDGTEYLMDIARKVQMTLRSTGSEVPHLKLLAWEPGGDYGKVDLLGVERRIEITRRFSRPCTDIAVLLNATAVCPADRLDKAIMEAVKTSSQLYQLDLLFFKKQCFNLGK